MLRLGIAVCAVVAFALAEGFTFTSATRWHPRIFRPKRPRLCFARKAARSRRSHKSAVPPKGW